MRETDHNLPEKRPAVDFTDPQTMQRIRGAFMGVDPDDAGPGIRRGRDGRPMITVSREVFEKLKAGHPVPGLEVYPFED